jgi:hypothetical protein
LVYRKRKDSLDLPGHFNIQSIPTLASSRLVQDRFTRKEEEKKPPSEFSHLGIGSFIIKKLVEAHAGTISAISAQQDNRSRMIKEIGGLDISFTRKNKPVERSP